MAPRLIASGVCAAIAGAAMVVAVSSSPSFAFTLSSPSVTDQVIKADVHQIYYYRRHYYYHHYYHRYYRPHYHHYYHPYYHHYYHLHTILIIITAITIIATTIAPTTIHTTTPIIIIPIIIVIIIISCISVTGAAARTLDHINIEDA